MPKPTIIAALAAILSCGSAEAAPQQSMTAAEAKRIVLPLYDALNEPSKKDVAGLLRSSTTPDFRSCANETECGGRAYLTDRFVRFGKIIPDLHWAIKDVWVAGDKVFVRGEATGTPVAAFFGTQPTGKSFKTMSLDMFLIRGGKIAFSYHVENWISAVQQVAGK